MSAQVIDELTALVQNEIATASRKAHSLIKRVVAASAQIKVFAEHPLKINSQSNAMISSQPLATEMAVTAVREMTTMAHEITHNACESAKASGRLSKQALEPARMVRNLTI